MDEPAVGRPGVGVPMNLPPTAYTDVVRPRQDRRTKRLSWTVRGGIGVGGVVFLVFLLRVSSEGEQLFKLLAGVGSALITCALLRLSMRRSTTPAAAQSPSTRAPRSRPSPTAPMAAHRSTSMRKAASPRSPATTSDSQLPSPAPTAKPSPPRTTPPAKSPRSRRPTAASSPSPTTTTAT